MNLEQFRTVLDIGSDSDGRTVLPVADPNSERVFGGQILAQLVACAAPGKTVKSLQVAFPRSGRPREPLYLDLEKTHDGHSLGVRHANVFQEQSLGGRRIVAPGRSCWTAPTTNMTTNSTPCRPQIRWRPNRSISPWYPARPG